MFLLVAGLTGSLLAWFDELEVLLGPELQLAQAPRANEQALDPLVLRERVLAHYPGTDVQGVSLAIKPGHSVGFFLEALPDPATGLSTELVHDQVFVDPYTGELLGGRRWGDIAQGRQGFMTFVYRLHYALALGKLGTLLMGVVALVWTLDSVFGAALTLPMPVRGAGDKPSWFERWGPAWKLRWRGGAQKLNFDLHRAGGLWLWAMLFVLAWSSVGFNLPQVYKPVMGALFAHQGDLDAIAKLAVPQRQPGIAWRQARDIGRRLMAEQAAQRGFAVLCEDWLSYDVSRAVYRYEVRSSLDVRERSGQTSVLFDANTGELRGLWLPTGAARGDTLSTWMSTLHMAGLWGAPLKVFVCLMGLAITMLSVTGVIIWVRKRAARAKSVGGRVGSVGKQS